MLKFGALQISELFGFHGIALFVHVEKKSEMVLSQCWNSALHLWRELTEFWCVGKGWFHPCSLKRGLESFGLNVFTIISLTDI